MYIFLATLVFVAGVFMSMGVLRALRIHGFGVIFYPPLFIFVFYLGFFVFPSALALAFQDSLTYRYVPEGYSVQSWVAAELYAFFFVSLSASIAMKTFGLGAFLRLHERAFNRIRTALTPPGRLLYFTVFYVLPMASLLFAVLKFGGSNYDDYMLNRTASRKGLGYLLMPSLWFGITLTVIFLRDVLIRRKYMSLIWLALGIAGFTLVNLYLGSKSRGLIVVAYCILVGFFFYSAKSRVNLRKILLSVCLVVGISYVGLRFGDIRESVTRGVDISTIDTRADVDSLFSKFNAFGAIENTVWLFEYMEADQVSYGATFASILAGPIPRAFWPEKPVGGGPQLRNMISPGSYDIVKGERLTSYSPGIIAESYMNFWIFGLVLVAPVFGIGLGLYAKLLKSTTSVLGIVVWVVCLFKLGYILTGEVLATISSLFQIAVAVAILSLSAKLLRFEIFRRA